MFSAFKKFGRMGGGSSIPWTPTKLFAAGEAGGLWDFSTLANLYQDSAGTTPCTAVGDPIGKVLDTSGRGNHLTQATSTKRPVLGRMPATGVRNFLWADLTGSSTGAGGWTKQTGVTVDSLGSDIYRINFNADGQGVFSSITGSNGGQTSVIGVSYIGSVDLRVESGTGTVTLREPIGSQFADTDIAVTTSWTRAQTPANIASSTDFG